MPHSQVCDLPAIRARVALIGQLSDGLIRLGPFSLGLDGVLSWVPGLGEIYSLAAGTYLIVLGRRAGVPASTLVLVAALIGGRTLITLAPGVGAAAADLLTTHRWSANLIVAAIDRIIAGQGASSPSASGWRGPSRATTPISA